MKSSAAVEPVSDAVGGRTAPTVRVLIVEDEPAHARYAADMLSEAEARRYVVDTAIGLEAALAHLREKPPAVMVMKLGLAGAEGLDALHRVRVQAPSVPVIALLDPTDEELATGATEAGASDFLIKGRYDRELLARAVRYTLDRQRLAAQLQESRVHTGALEAAANAVIITDAAGTIVWVNPAFTSMTGYSPEEVMGRNPRILKSGRQGGAAYQTLWDTILSGRVWTGELVNRKKDGTHYTEEMTVTPLRSETGTVSHFIAIKQDVTRRKEMEATLQEAQRRLQHVLSSSPAALFTLRTEGEGPVFVCTWISDNVERLLGCKAEEIMTPGGWDSRLHPEDRARVFAEMGRLISDGHLVQEYRFRDHGGGYRWLRDEKILLRDSAGTAVEVVGSWSDIAARKQAEMDLQESEKKYRVLFDRNPHPMWVFDEETLAFLAVNDAAVRHYGWEREQWLAMTVLDIRPPDEIPGFRAVYDQALWEDPSTRRFERFKHRKKDGTVIEVDIAASRISFEGRKARLILATDVTEKRSLEAQLAQSQKMESVGRLAGGVAHDFNNLLGVIGGYGELVRKRVKGDPRLLHYVEDIVKAADRAAGLTRQLLAFSRKQVLQPKVLDLNAVVGEMEKMLRRLIGEDVQLATVFDDRLGTVKADPGQVEQVLMNLVVNARDAMPRGGRLTIETQNVDLDRKYCRRHPEVPPGRYVMIAVSDTGQGMPPEVKARLFEPFFTTKAPGKGTGLGLATVHGIVKQSGGHVSVYSEEGHGTTFKIYLPRTDDAKEEAGVAVEPEVPRGSETILLVEDEGSLRELIREWLEGAGYTVLEGRHGAEALQIGESHPGPIDLVLTDVVMPTMNGRELATQVVAARPQIRTVYMSGYTDDAVVRHGVLGEEVSFLQKPFTEAALAKKLREVLDGRAMAR
jgi:PAS domain S-box-containing protein